MKDLVMCPSGLLWGVEDKYGVNLGRKGVKKQDIGVADTRVGWELDVWVLGCRKQFYGQEMKHTEGVLTILLSVKA